MTPNAVMDPAAVAPGDALPRVYLVQLGARRNYELLRLLAGGAEVVRFATSTAWEEGSPNTLFRSLVAKRRPGVALRRTIAGLARGRLLAAPLADFAFALARLAGRPMQSRRAFASWVLGRAVRRDGWHGAEVLFTVDGNGGPAMIEAARQAGLKVVSDFVVTPKAFHRMREEDLRWPGFTRRKLSEGDVRRFEAGYRRLAQLSDLMICPSETVIDGIRDIAPEAVGRCVMVPYGLSGHRIRAGEPVWGRVLFAGSDATRKGLPYLGLAATRLKALGCNTEVRVAGGFPNFVREQPECRDLVFLGHLDRRTMEQEYQKADVFCLPSLAEGSASVVLEAMAAGVPCVVTRSVGSTVVNGCEGLLVPERDADALAAAIRGIVEDRELRARMSQAALQRAANHGVDRLAPELTAKIAAIARQADVLR